jgi:HK97 family phage portal protein
MRLFRRILAALSRKSAQIVMAPPRSPAASTAGVLLGRDTALESAAVYAAVKIIAEDVASLPLHLYRRRSGRTERATDHPLYRLLHDAPNPDMTAGDLIEAVTASALLWGNGYARVERIPNREDGEIVAIYPIDPDRVELREAREGWRERPVYIYRSYRGGREELEPWQILHLRGFTLTGRRGDDLVARARQVLGLTIAAQEFAARWFSQGAAPGIVLERPVGAPPLTAEGLRRLKESVAEWHVGLAHAHEPMVLQEGTTVKRITGSLEESQLIDQRRFQVLEICRLFRLPPHKLAELERATHTNIEEENISYLSQTLAPWLRRWRQSIWRTLLTPEERAAGELFAEHEVEAFLRGNFRAQAEAWARLLQAGVYSINEVRRWLNLNPVPGGDEHFIQLNMQAVTAMAGAEAEETSTGSVKRIAWRDYATD